MDCGVPASIGHKSGHGFYGYTLYVIAGPNGSEKSTLAAQLRAEFATPPGIWINADEIAARMRAESSDNTDKSLTATIEADRLRHATLDAGRDLAGVLAGSAYCGFRKICDGVHQCRDVVACDGVDVAVVIAKCDRIGIQALQRVDRYR